MPQFGCIVIVGTGFMGSSIAKALHRKSICRRIVGVETNTEHYSIAESADFFDAVYDSNEELASHESDIELVLVCTPVHTVPSVVVDYAQRFPGATLTDIGSSKKEISAKINAAFDGLELSNNRFVPGHPIAGGDTIGPFSGNNEASEAKFEDRVFIATPGENTNPDALETVKRLWTAIGSKVVELTPEAHDEILATTSHLPHVVASALSALLDTQTNLAAPDSAEDFREIDFCGSGWSDLTRIAKSNPLLWKEILVQNRGSLLKSLERFQESFAALHDAIQKENWDTVLSILKKGKSNRDALGN